MNTSQGRRSSPSTILSREERIALIRAENERLHPRDERVAAFVAYANERPPVLAERAYLSHHGYDSTSR